MDAEYSWAIFLEEEVRKLGNGVVMRGAASPIETGMSKYEADGRKSILNQLEVNRRKRDAHAYIK